MGKLTDDVLKWTLDINGDPARKELTEVGNATNKLERDNRALGTEMAKLEAHGKKGSEEWKKYEAQIKANDTAIIGNKKRMEELRKEVGLNNLSSVELRKEMKNLKTQMDRIDPSSKQWKEMNLEFSTMQGRLSQIRGGVTSVDGVFGKFKQTAGALLPAFGFAAISAGAKFAFDKVVTSTDFLSTKWAVFTGGLKSGMNEFWRSIAVGDWSNFTENMKTAISVGREYETMLDDIEEKNRALKIKEAEARKTELDLEEKLKNKGLSKAERLAAGQERIKIEEDLAKERVKVAQDTFDAELKVTQQQTRLSKDRLMEVISDMDSETKAKAKSYNEQLSLYKSLQQKNSQLRSISATTQNKDYVDPYQKRIEESKAVLDLYLDSIKRYAEALRGAGATTDEQLNKMVSSYEGLLQAQNSAAENTKKVRTMVNSLLADEKKGVKTIVDLEDAKAATEALDLAYKQQTLLLKQKYSDEETLQKEYHVRMLATEIAYMQTKSQIITDEQAKLDLQSQLIDKEKEYRLALQATVPEILKTDRGIQNLNTRLIEESKLLTFAAQKQTEGSIALANLTAKQQLQADTIKMAGDILTDYVTGALDGSIDGFQSFGETLILMSLQILKSMVPIWSAQILGLSLASPESVATWGIAGLAKYAAITGLMYAGIAAAEGLVKGGINKKRQATGSKQSGGYADGSASDSTPAGIYHANEFIASAPAVRNPTVKPYLDLIDMAQRAGTIRSLNLSAMVTGRQSGGYASHISTNNSQISTNNSQIVPSQSTIDPNSANRLADSIDRLIKWKPKIYAEQVKKDLDDLDNIQKNRGL